MALAVQVRFENIVRRSGPDRASRAGPSSREQCHAGQGGRLRPWTITALNRLKQYAQEGMGIAEIQRWHFPDRTYAAVFAQVRKLGLAGQTGCLQYQEEELTQIRTLVEKDGLTATESVATGLLPARSADSIHIQIGRLGLVDIERSDAVRHARPWTKDEERLLKRLVSERLTTKQIIRGNHLPERTAPAIHERIYRRQLADPKRSEDAKKTRG